MSAVHVLVPADVDDPARPSGGNTYDRRVCRDLAGLGWTVHEHAVSGGVALARTLRSIPVGAVVLLDGLIASAHPEIFVREANRLREIVLVHMPLGDLDEREVLSAAAAVVTTSEWSRRRLAELHALPPERVHVAEPGVDAATLAPGTGTGGSLLCAANVTPGKGHDVLLDALLAVTDLSWRCACAGSLVRDPGFAEAMRLRARAAGLANRVRFVGPRTGRELDRAYASADLLVLASHAESYGMVVTEALARGLPVVATDTGGVAEALGHGKDGALPGVLVPPDDPAALAGALRAWLEDAELRTRLRRAAHERRAALRPWAATSTDVAHVLAAAEGSPDSAAGLAGVAR